MEIPPERDGRIHSAICITQLNRKRALRTSTFRSPAIGATSGGSGDCRCDCFALHALEPIATIQSRWSRTPLTIVSRRILFLTAYEAIPNGQVSSSYVTALSRISHDNDILRNDGLDRRISEQVISYDQTGAITSNQTTRYLFEGAQELFAVGENGKIVRASLPGSNPGEIWATDETSTPKTATVWQFTDPNGTARTLARYMRVPQGGSNWVLQQSDFSTDGEITQRLVTSTDTALASAPVVWHGQKYDPASQLYQVNGSWYDPISGRYVADSHADDDVNPYRYNEGDPVNDRLASIYGPGVYSGVWGSYTAFGTGVGDALSAGWFSHLAGGEDVTKQLSTNAWYWGGIAAGTVAQIVAGYGSAQLLCRSGGALAAARAYGTLSVAQKAAVGYAGYSTAMDFAGALQSSYNIGRGQFSALDLLGLAPAVGWTIGGFTAHVSQPAHRSLPQTDSCQSKN